MVNGHAADLYETPSPVLTEGPGPKLPPELQSQCLAGPGLRVTHFCAMSSSELLRGVHGNGLLLVLPALIMSAERVGTLSPSSGGKGSTGCTAGEEA